MGTIKEVGIVVYQQRLKQECVEEKTNGAGIAFHGHNTSSSGGGIFCNGFGGALTQTEIQ